MNDLRTAMTQLDECVDSLREDMKFCLSSALPQPISTKSDECEVPTSELCHDIKVLTERVKSLIQQVQDLRERLALPS